MEYAASVNAVMSVVEDLLIGRVVGFETIPGGLTHALTGIAALSDGSRVFVKAGLDETSRPQVAAEIANLAWLRGSFLPRVIATSIDPPILVLEDLSSGNWPEPYPNDLTALEAALGELRTMPVPGAASLSALAPPGEEVLGRLETDASVAVPPAASWVEAHGGAIRAAVSGVGGGQALVHADLWYSNLCFLPDRVVIVDWSHLHRGSPWYDASTVSIDLIIEGRRPLEIEDAVGWAAVHTAWVIWALAAGPGDAISDPERWRRDNLELFDGAAWWFAREVGVESPPRMTDRAVGWATA